MTAGRASSFNAMTVIQNAESVNLFCGTCTKKGYAMQDRKLTPDMVPVIKLAVKLGYNYARITAYFQLNFGRVADVVKGRRFPEIPPARTLPSDFPTA